MKKKNRIKVQNNFVVKLSYEDVAGIQFFFTKHSYLDSREREKETFRERKQGIK